MAYLATITKWTEPWGAVAYGAVGMLVFLILLLGISFGHLSSCISTWKARISKIL